MKCIIDPILINEELFIQYCNKCDTSKPIEQFPFKNKKNNKRSTVCGHCQRVYKLTYYYNNKQSHYDRNKILTEKLTLFVSILKSSSSCYICDEYTTCCLDFHHIDRKSKVGEVSVLVRYGSMKRLREEICKCVILCSNCHRKVHAGIISLLNPKTIKL